MKLLKTVLIVLIALIVVVALTKNTIAKIGVEKGVEAVTGLKMKISSLNIGVINTLVGINDMKLYNPKGYEDPVMLDMEEIYVDYDLPAILKGTIHLPEMRLALKEFIVVKNEEGELNLNALKVVKEEKARDKQAPAKETKKQGKAPDIQIDKLRLKVGKVIYKDYSKGGSPAVKEFNINIDEEFTGINDPNKLVSLIVVKALMSTPIASLTNFDLGGLESTVSETLAGAQEVTKQLVSTAGKTLSSTTKETQAVVKETTDVLKSTANDLKESLKIPFGRGSEK
jgi:uncharacterized protein involved in outer membrane biogenesis